MSIVLDLPDSLNTLKTSASGVATKVDDLTKLSSDSCSLLGSMGSMMGGQIKDAASETEKSIGQAVGSLGSISSDISQSIAKITSLFKQLEKKIPNMGDSDLQKIQDAIDKINGSITSVTSTVSSSITNLTNSLSGITTQLKTCTATLTTASCNNTMDALKSLGDGASANADKIKGAAEAAAGSASTSAAAAINTSLNSAGASSAVDAVKNNTATLTTAISDAAKKSSAFIKDGLKTLEKSLA